MIRIKKGFLHIPISQYDLNLIKSLPPILVLFHEYRMDKKEVYLAVECDLFDWVADGQETPWYDIIFDSNGFKEFRRVEK